MLKKRLIFTLLYDSGYFMLSRNFRLQRVGTLDWLQHHYNFARIAFFIDELIVLDVSRSQRNPEVFCDTLKALTAGCFVPIAAGGGIRSIEDAHRLLRSGADKIVVNTPLFETPDLIARLAEEFGQQCVVGSVDVKRDSDFLYHAYIANGTQKIDRNITQAISWIDEGHVGELYVNSMDRDGTGQGYDFDILDRLPGIHSIPVILAGGAGNGTHLLAGLDDVRVDAVATAHLFNFLGNGLQRARGFIMEQQAKHLASWPSVQDVIM